MGALHKVTVYTMADITEAVTKKEQQVTESFVSFQSTFSMKRFGADQDLKNSTESQLLYVPKNSRFKAWELIVHTPPMTADQPHQVVFIQVSTETLRSHDAIPGGGFLFQNSLNNPMDPKNGIGS